MVEEPEHRGRPDDAMHYVPKSLREAAPSSFLDPQEMRRMAEEANRRRTRGFIAAGGTPDPDVEASIAAVRRAEAARSRFGRWLDWNLRLLRAWVGRKWRA